MESYKLLSMLAFLIFMLCTWRTDGHGRLIEPPSRSSMWRYGFSTSPNYNDHELYCGGKLISFLWLLKDFLFNCKTVILVLLVPSMKKYYSSDQKDKKNNFKTLIIIPDIQLLYIYISISLIMTNLILKKKISFNVQTIQ